MVIESNIDIQKNTNNIWINEMLKEEEELQLLNDGKIKWNDNLEKETYKIAHDCNYYKINHIKYSIKYDRIYTFFIIIGILLGPISSTIATTGEFPCSTIAILSSITGYISGIIIAIIKFGKFEVLSIHNKNAAMKYNSLENNIRRQLSLNRNDRIHPKHYLKWIEIKFEEINCSSPLIHKNFLKINNEIIQKNESNEISQKVNSKEIKKIIQNDENNGKHKVNEYLINLNNKSSPNILNTENIDKMLLYEMERLKR